MTAVRTSVIDGVQRQALECHSDHRGDLVELFVDGWFEGFGAAQWNYLHSEPNTLRGFHCHVKHHDVITLLSGGGMLGLKDLREDSPTAGRSEVVALRPTSEAILIPPGVGHGFYFPVASIIVFAVSRRWDPDDELGCRWDDPDLDIDWGCTEPRLSDRDRLSGNLAELRADVRSRGLRSV